MDNYSWHPVYQECGNCRRFYNASEFELALKVINRLCAALSVRSQEARRQNTIDKSGKKIVEVYGIELYNEYHPSKRVESWYYVDTTDWQSWWLSPSELALIKKYGWTIECDNYDADCVNYDADCVVSKL